MSTQKEFREFFIRNEKVQSGQKADQEVNYPTVYQVGQRMVGNRFLKGHYPSEGVMSKFVHSITFKLNKEDRATQLGQGLAKVPSHAQVYAEQDSIDGFTYFVLPSQLPKVISSNNDVDLETLDIPVKEYLEIPKAIGEFIKSTKLPIDQTNGRIIYDVKLNTPFFQWLAESFNAVKNYVDKINISGEIQYVNLNDEKANTVEVLINDEFNTEDAKRFIIVIYLPTQNVSNQTITNICNQILSEYNPLDHLPIGTIIECNNPEHFNFTTGLGKPNTPYSKWAIADGRNGTRDKRDRFSKGVVSTNPGSEATIGWQGGNKLVTLTKNNLPPHKHSYLFAGYRKASGSDDSDFTSLISKGLTGGVVLHNESLNTTNVSKIQANSVQDVQEHTIFASSNNGTTNVDTNDRFGANITPIDIENKYDISLFVQKIL